MIFALLIFLAVGLFLSVAPGAALGCLFVVVSRKRSLRVRIPLLVVLAVGSGGAWLAVLGADNGWRSIVAVLSVAATLLSGTASFAFEAALRRRVRRSRLPVWPDWHPPAGVK